jgi:outer membrane protein assembly factor BamD (BamD/ComL family)
MVVNTSQEKTRRNWRRRVWASCFLVPWSCCLGGGCSWDQYNPFKVEAPPPPVDTLTLRGDKLEPVVLPTDAKDQKATLELAGAHDLYRQGEYARAERVYHHIADNKKTPPTVAEEARYYEAESLRHQGHYPKAADTYNRMLIDFPSGAYRESAVQHMFEIANFWLEDTRNEMAMIEEKKAGKRWFVTPEWVHIENTKPLFDEEGRALEKLEQVRYNDITGPLADKALFLAGSIKFFRKDYREANHYYSQLVEMHPNSPYVQQAIKLAIICKQLSTGGPAYDARNLAEARKLVDTALRNYPELASKEADFLNRQLYTITLQQAAKDFEVAELYRRLGKPCSAYFCYEIVRRRYPNTTYYDHATERMQELRAKVEKAQQEEKAPKLPPDLGRPDAGATPRPLPADMVGPDRAGGNS